MSSFVPRLTAPLTSDRNWISLSKNGYNPCLIIDPDSGLVIPNCVGYTWGRWREILGYYHNLYTGNAENAWSYTADGYRRGQSPQLGAVICFYRTGGGHTAVVEEIIDSTHIRTSNSAYGGTYFWTEVVTNINGVWTRPYSGYTFQGFIYCPESFLDVPIWLLFHNKRKRRKTK